MLHYTTSAATAGMSNHHHELGTGSGPTRSGSNLTNNNNNSNDLLSGQDNNYSDSPPPQSVPWEYEEITIERGPNGLGFTVAGGIDNPHYRDDNNIYITRLIPNGPAHSDGRLKLEDIIVRVNDTELIDVRHSEAVSALKYSGNRVQLLIKRRKRLTKTNNEINNPIGKTISYTIKHRQQQLHQNNKQNNSGHTPVLFTSTLSNAQIPNQLPPLPRAAQSGPLRGSAQYSTTRETSSTNRAPRLKGASSSLSLQQPVADEVDTPSRSGFNTNSFSRENVSSAGHSRSTSAIDFDTARSLTRLPRTVILQRSQRGLGFNIVGGVAGGGTFISYIVPGGAAEKSGKLHCGDQVLSVNGIDLRSATHEEAASALKQAGQTVKLVVKYKPEEYIKFENKINDLRERSMLYAGTLQTSQKRSLYARALFDYDPSKDSGLPSKGLPFKFGDILHIINASDDEWWQAKKVLEDGQDDTAHGIIPSKRRVEKRERSRLKTVKFINRNCSESTLDRRAKRFTFSKKFPFMKSRENVGIDELDILGSQSNSRGILSSSSTTSINANSERGSIRNFNDEPVMSYEPVLQQEINYTRPIALYGPVKDEIEGLREDLSCDDRFYKMESIVPYTTRPPKEGEKDGVKYHFVTMQEMKRDLAKHKFVEAGELNHHLYGTSIDSIREIAESGKHCLLNISPKAIKRLHDANIYPIVVFIKPKSIESLLEMNKRWTHEEAAAALDYANRLEQEFGSLFTSTIQPETPNETLREITNVISNQSGPRIWIPTTFEALNVS